MQEVVQQTRFYKSPEEAIGLFESEKFRNDTMPKVVDFCVEHAITESKPTVGFGDASAQLNFDATYIKNLQSQ
jgi:hypothetical protein